MKVIALRVKYALLASLFSLLITAQMRSATLSPATVAEWNSEVKRVNLEAQRRSKSKTDFLLVSSDPKRAARLRRGEIAVSRVAEKNDHQVPGGLIHHWTGAMFVPRVKLAEVVEVTRDYNRYKEFYRPAVVDSKLISRSASEDRFSMLLMNKAFFLETALQAEYHVDNIAVDERRQYSVSQTTKVREIKGFGSPNEQALPEGEGSGYIWKLFSVVRLEQKDEGVYLEVEVMALSRDIPAPVRFFAEPIVRNISRNSLVISLQQTQQALLGVTARNRPPARKNGGLAFMDNY